jgi:hypothetical protein
MMWILDKIQPDAIKIEGWDLILPESVSATTISPVTGTPSSPTARHGGHVTARKIVEAKQLTWDSASKSFLLEAQEIVYSREVFGGGGVSGIRIKTLPLPI